MNKLGWVLLGWWVVCSAHALECEDGALTEVSGTVKTRNLSEQIQRGRICLTLTRETGGVAFDGCGGILGQITGQTDDGATLLNHYACFDGINCLFTEDDKAFFLEPTALHPATGQACAFKVVEKIRHVSGTSVFRHIRARIDAVGSVSFCPGDNRNQFTLSGKACLAED